MAFPLVGGSVSSAGITVSIPRVVKKISVTRVWSPVPLFNPQRFSAGVHISVRPPVQTVTGVRIWSGTAGATGVWPDHGQGWPRINQR